MAGLLTQRAGVAGLPTRPRDPRFGVEQGVHRLGVGGGGGLDRRRLGLAGAGGELALVRQRHGALHHGRRPLGRDALGRRLGRPGQLLGAGPCCLGRRRGVLGLGDPPAQRFDLAPQLTGVLAGRLGALADACGLILGLGGALGGLGDRLLAPAALGLRALGSGSGVACHLGEARHQLGPLVGRALEAQLELGQFALQLGQRVLGLLRAPGDGLLRQLGPARAALGQHGAVDDRRPRRLRGAGLGVPRHRELDLDVAHGEPHAGAQGRPQLLGHRERRAERVGP
jgi:hypothetical protein